MLALRGGAAQAETAEAAEIDERQRRTSTSSARVRHPPARAHGDTLGRPLTHSRGTMLKWRAAYGCTSAVLRIRRARDANRKVLSVSSTWADPGETVEMMTARAAPPRHGCSSRVSFESRSGQAGRPGVRVCRAGERALHPRGAGVREGGGADHMMIFDLAPPHAVAWRWRGGGVAVAWRWRGGSVAMARRWRGGGAAVASRWRVRCLMVAGVRQPTRPSQGRWVCAPSARRWTIVDSERSDLLIRALSSVSSTLLVVTWPLLVAEALPMPPLPRGGWVRFAQIVAARRAAGDCGGS